MPQLGTEHVDIDDQTTGLDQFFCLFYRHPAPLKKSVIFHYFFQLIFFQFSRIATGGCTRASRNFFSIFFQKFERESLQADETGITRINPASPPQDVDYSKKKKGCVRLQGLKVSYCDSKIFNKKHPRIMTVLDDVQKEEQHLSSSREHAFKSAVEK